MSKASDSAHVRIVIADYAAEGQGAKITLVGAGVNIIGYNGVAQVTAPFAVWATVTFPPAFVGHGPSVELRLEDADGQLIEIEIDGRNQPVHVRSNQELPPTNLPNLELPEEAVRPKAQMLMQFQTGLPLKAGHHYRWRVMVDDETSDEWTELIYVPAMKSSTSPTT